jgi:hypothetical protein
MTKILRLYAGFCFGLKLTGHILLLDDSFFRWSKNTKLEATIHTDTDTQRRMDKDDGGWSKTIHPSYMH